MASRVQQDAFIDDSDESCPLCVEEFDLSDKNFRPCPCGYQNQINGLCPACRRPYVDQNIEWKVVSPEEQKADLALQQRKKAMARKKESEQKQVETSNRKNLAGIRVLQKNLVYVVGLSQKSSEEEFLRTLRGPQYFGQYGKITKIVVSKAKEGNSSIGVYVTFESKEDAAKCIAAVDGSQNLDRPLRAQYGTTKYCSAFLRNETCQNRTCTFLHETGEDNDSFSRQDLSSMNALSTRGPAQQSSSSRPAQPPQQPHPHPPPQQAPQNIAAAKQPATHDEAMSRSDSGDGSALPSSASWAAKNTHTESRRSSKPASAAASSPSVAPATVSSQPTETRQVPTETETPVQNPEAHPLPQTLPLRQRSPDPQHPLDSVMQILIKSNFKYSFDRSLYDEDQLKQIESYPPLFDDHGGLVRYKMAKAEEQERQKQEEERNALGAIASTTDEEEETPASGSLQLGGEPETQDGSQDASGRMSAQPRSAIQPPFASSTAFPFSGPGFQAANAAGLSRTLTPQQQQHLSLLRSQSSRQSPVSSNQYQQGYGGNTSMHHHQQSNPFQMQNQSQFSTAQGHARQASRFTFANDTASASTAVKPVANPQLMAQQAAMMPSNQNKHFQNQQSQQAGMHGNHFYSGVQGPPPGLKSSGTPPISGGGMFGQGHGFAVAMGGSAGFGSNISTKNSNDELMRDLMRARNGSANGQGPDIGKREFNFPFSQQPMTSDSPASSLLSSLYGSQLGTPHGYQDHNLQKQKKKGKKHRHANTSSSGGGGIVDLADPSILQARMHHGAAGQGQFGAQGQDLSDPSLQQNPKPSNRPAEQPNAPLADKNQPKKIATPAPVPLGLSLPQDFPPLAAPSAPPPAPPRIQRKTTSGAAIKPVVPVLPAHSTRPTGASKDTQVDDTDKVPGLAENVNRADTIDDGKSTVNPSMTADSSSSSADVKSKKPLLPTKPTEKKHRPGNLDIAATMEAPKGSVKAGDIPAHSMTQNNGEILNAFEASIPPTPVTAVSQTSAAPAARSSQPRTIRVAPTGKAEISSPGVASSKQASRRASLSSTHHPATPTSERNSDSISFTTTSVSRANSPPPSKVGSAPIRQVTKSQQKKERQARAKQIEGSSKAEEPPVPKVEEEQAPIIGRKKKTKKQKSQGTADSTPTATRPTSPVNKEDMADEEPAPGPATPLKESKNGSANAAVIDSQPSETPSNSATPAASEQQPKPTPLSAQSIISSLIKSGDISASVVDRLFKNPAPGLNHRFEPIEPDYPPDHPNYGPTEEQLHSLIDKGEAIDVVKGPNHHVIILPSGAGKKDGHGEKRLQIAGMTTAQATRYLELRKSLLSRGETPTTTGIDPNATQLVDIDAAISKHREQRGEAGDTMKLVNPFLLTPATTNNTNTITNNRATTTTTTTGAQHENITQRLLGAAPTAAEKKQMSVSEAEGVLAQARKETESLEKRLAGLVKRNRRLVMGGMH
ncbi:transcriptional repressor general negative regulator of transcription subunit 4 [Lecanora helva]